MEKKHEDKNKVKRFERKYIERKNNSYLFRNFLLKKNFYKKFENRIVNSVYFDDFNFSSYKNNVEGNTKRLKVRIRWYNENSDNLNLEIKNKNGFLGWKNTYKLNYIDGINNVLNNYSNSKLENTINNVLKKNVFPVIKTKYQREYYEYNHDTIRATIDTKLEYLSTRINFKIAYDKEILEFKYPVTKDKLFRENIIKNNKFRFQKFSKYVVGVNLFNKNLLI